MPSSAYGWSGVFFSGFSGFHPPLMNDRLDIRKKNSLLDGGKLKESEGYNYFFHHFLCVRIEIDQLLCLIC